jgi:hypothetical protein
MMNFHELPSAPPDHPAPFTDQLRLAVAAYLARFKGPSRYHTESDLRCYLAWCAERGLDPAGRAPPAPGAVHPVDAGDPPVQLSREAAATTAHTTSGCRMSLWAPLNCD